MMSIEYNVQCFCPGCDEGLDVNTSPVMFLPPFTLQIVQPGKRLPLSKVDCNRTCTISLLKDIWVCLFHMCVNMWVQFTGLCMCVWTFACAYLYLIQEALPFFFSLPTLIVSALMLQSLACPLGHMLTFCIKPFSLKLWHLLLIWHLCRCASLWFRSQLKRRRMVCVMCAPQREAVSHIHWPYL